MPYFFAPQALASGQTVTLEGEEASHLLKSRRLRAGDVFALQDPTGNRFSAEVMEVRRSAALVRIGQALPVPALPPVRLCLLLAAVKDKALELVLQKATELGVADLVIFPSEHSPVSHDELHAPKTVARWERILREACKQCDRQFPPTLRVVDDLVAALAAAPATEMRLMLDPRAARSAAEYLAATGAAAGVTVLIGPEGGFSPTEEERARAAGFGAVSLGELILRAETAAIAIAAVVLLGQARGPG